MRPYYEDGGIALYLGDCREVLPALGLRFDAAIADPPYAQTSLAWDRWPDGWPAVVAGAPVGGADFLILQALRAGCSSAPAVAEYARVELSAAREALNRLRGQGQVRRYGDKRGSRYIAVKRRGVRR